MRSPYPFDGTVPDPEKKRPGLRELAKRVKVSREPLPNTLWAYELSCPCGETTTKSTDSRFVGSTVGIPFYNEGWRLTEKGLRCPGCGDNR